MHARRTIAGCIAAACVTGGTLGMAQHQGSDVSTAQVGISTAITAQRTSSTLPNEPSTTMVAVQLTPPVTSVPRLTPCDTPVDDLADADGQAWLSDELVARCDYRVTGARCEEDEVCAVQQIRSTGDFTGTR